MLKASRRISFAHDQTLVNLASLSRNARDGNRSSLLLDNTATSLAPSISECNTEDVDKPDSDLNVNEYDEEAGVIDESEVVVRRSLTNVERNASVRSSSTSAEKTEAFMRDSVNSDVVQPPEEEL